LLDPGIEVFRSVVLLIMWRSFLQAIWRKQLRLPAFTDSKRLGLTSYVEDLQVMKGKCFTSALSKPVESPRKAGMDRRDKPLRQISPQRLRQIALKTTGQTYRASRWQLSIYDQLYGKGQDLVALFGVTQYDNLTTLEASKYDVQAMADLITESIHQASPELSADQFVVAAVDPDLEHFEISLDAALSRAKNGSLLVYFSGHGLILDGELYLAFRHTVSGRLVTTAFPTYKFLDLVSQYHIANLVLVLDCCYASAAADSLGLALDRVAPTLDLLHKRDEEALTILAASARSDEALATSKQSVFTEVFVHSARELFESRGAVVVSDLCEAIGRKMDALRLGQQLGIFASAQGKATVILSELPAFRRLSDQVKFLIAERLSKQGSALRAVAARVIRDWDKEPKVPAGWTLVKLRRRVDIFSRVLGWDLDFVIVGPEGIAAYRPENWSEFPADKVLEVRMDRERIMGGMAVAPSVNVEISIVDTNLRVSSLFRETDVDHRYRYKHAELFDALNTAVDMYQQDRRKAELGGVNLFH